MKKYFNISVAYLIIGLALGVFNREFTKMNNFEGVTVLASAHTHTLVLGFLFMLLLVVIEKLFDFSNNKSEKAWFITYNIGLIFLLSTLVTRGILQVTGGDVSGLNHIAGFGHAILGIALIWFVVLLNKSLKQDINENKVS